MRDQYRASRASRTTASDEPPWCFRNAAIRSAVSTATRTVVVAAAIQARLRQTTGIRLHNQSTQWLPAREPESVYYRPAGSGRCSHSLRRKGRMAAQVIHVRSWNALYRVPCTPDVTGQGVEASHLVGEERQLGR